MCLPVNMQPIVDQIWQVGESVLTIATYHVGCDARYAVAVCDDGGWHLEAPNRQICVQVEHPDRSRLDLRCVARILEVSGINEPQAIAFVNSRPIH